MKPCPFCAEEIQDNAVRCKHCGGDINEYIEKQLVQEIQANELKTKEKISNFFIIASLVVGFLLGLFLAWGATDFLTTPKLVLCVFLSTILFPLGISTGWSIGKAMKPDLFLAQSQIDLFWKKVQYAIVPYILAIVAGAVFTVLPFYYFVDSAKAENPPVVETLEPQ